MAVTDNGQTTRAEHYDAVNKLMAEMAGLSQGVQSVASGIRDHEQTWYAKPKQRTFREMKRDVDAAVEEEESRSPYVHTFKHRPWDVALAFNRVCKEHYGVTPVAVPGLSAQIEIPTGVHASVTIPYGHAEFVPLRAEIEYGEMPDPQLGLVGRLAITAQKLNHPILRGLCLMVEQDLKVNSIYKGKAITSDVQPRFMDPWEATDPRTIVWTRATDAALRGSLLNLIRHADRAKERGLPIHRTLLFEGEPGNGKSESINIIAQEAVANGYTAIFVTTTLGDALYQARMYARAVLFLEDIERLVNDAGAEQMSAFLEQLDGASAKGHEIMLVATTNYIEDLPKAVRRRMAKVISFGPFDAEAAERYLQIVLEGQATEDMDYEAVAREMNGWGNSYIAKAVEFAKGLALEHESSQLHTKDLLDSVASIKPEWEAYLKAKSRPEPEPLVQVLKEVMIDAVGSGKIAWSEDGNYLVRAAS